MKKLSALVLFSLITVTSADSRRSPPRVIYRVTQTIAVGGDEGWDYVAVDSAARHVFVSHGTHVVVLDADSGKVVGDIPDTQGVHGIAIAPDAGRGFTSNGRANTVTVFDLKTFKDARHGKDWDKPRRNRLRSSDEPSLHDERSQSGHDCHQRRGQHCRGNAGARRETRIRGRRRQRKYLGQHRRQIRIGSLRFENAQGFESLADGSMSGTFRDWPPTGSHDAFSPAATTS